MPPHVRRVLQGKRLRLLEDLLRSIDYPDRHLCEDVRQGFSLTGWMRPSGDMESRLEPPCLSKQDLLRTSGARNQEMWNLCRSTGSAELDDALWQQTAKDVEQGWAELQATSGKPPDSGSLSRRFAVKQGDKVRAIDDFSISLVNRTVVQEKITVMTAADTASPQSLPTFPDQESRMQTDGTLF